MDETINYEKKVLQLKEDIVKMIYLAGSGHVGGSLSVLDILVALYYNVLKIDPKNPNMEDRDRMVLSKGHACPALYAVLADKGYFPKKDLSTLRKLGSHLQGHPDSRSTPGIDCNGGSLGQGASVAGGMAMAAKYLGKDYRVFAIIGDGESQEGLIWEVAMSAVQFKLDNFTLILDHNGLQIDGSNEEIMGVGNMCDKFAAFGWDVTRLEDGHDIAAITAALEKKVTGRPKFICCDTIKGHGISFMENNFMWHGKTIDEATYKAAMKELEEAVNG